MRRTTTYGSKYATAQTMPTPVCFFAWWAMSEAAFRRRRTTVEDWKGPVGTTSECGMMGREECGFYFCWCDLIERGVNPGQRTG